MNGQEGDTIATALLRNRVRTFDRSIKQRRKRGPACMEGFCMSCVLEVDNEPDVLACRTPLREGMHVQPQIAFPSPEFDFRSFFQAPAFKFFGPELYYRLFTRPVPVQHLWIRFLAAMSGRARLHLDQPPRPALPFQIVTTNVLVVGGGVAGIAAANEASKTGQDVLLVDRGLQPGGWWKRWHEMGGPPGEQQSPPEAEALAESVQVLRGTTLIGLYEDNSALAVSDQAAYRIHYENAVIAVGCYPQLVAFQGSDEPLYLPVQGIVRAISETGWKPKSVLLLDVDGQGQTWAKALETMGVQVQVHHVESTHEVENLQAAGNGTSSAVRFPSGEVARGEVVCWSAGWRARDELIRQIGGTFRYSPSLDRFMPEMQDGGLVSSHHYAAGGCAGIRGFAEAQKHGRRAGAIAAGQVQNGAG